MKVKSYSLMLGYKEFDAQLIKKNERFLLKIAELGEIDRQEYIRHGFRVIEAETKELKALVAIGFEKKSIFSRFSI